MMTNIFQKIHDLPLLGMAMWTRDPSTNSQPSIIWHQTLCLGFVTGCFWSRNTFQTEINFKTSKKRPFDQQLPHHREIVISATGLPNPKSASWRFWVICGVLTWVAVLDVLRKSCLGSKIALKTSELVKKTLKQQISFVQTSHFDYKSRFISEMRYPRPLVRTA